MENTCLNYRSCVCTGANCVVGWLKVGQTTRERAFILHPKLNPSYFKYGLSTSSDRRADISNSSVWT